MSLPTTKGDEITARLEALSKRSEVATFEVRPLNKVIEKLASVNTAESFVLGRLLAAITGLISICPRWRWMLLYNRAIWL